MKGPVIGIDLGTTYACCAVFQNDKVEIISNEQGNRKTPSFVSFADNEILVGEDAKYRGAKYSENTIFDAKRLIGKQYDDPQLQKDIEYYPFKITTQSDIEINFNDNIRKLNPEVILSMILKKMKLEAEVYLNKKVSEAVISVPNYYNEKQRQLVKESCELAGLSLLKLTNETSLVGLGFNVEKNISESKNIFIFDLGGGFLNTSVILMDKNKIEVKSVAGSCSVGGRDFDNRLVKYFLDEFKEKHKIDLDVNKRAIFRLRSICEKAKHELSLAVKTNIDIDSLFNEQDFNSSITRERFEELNVDLFIDMLEIVKKTLVDAKMTKAQIDEIVLVGGSTRIPKVQEILKEFFDGKSLNKSVNLDEVVAYGAAIQAALLSGYKSEVIQDLKLLDVVSLTLGIEITGESMAPMLKRNTIYPTKVTRLFACRSDNQKSILVKLFEGEGLMTRNNTLIANIDYEGTKHITQFEISLEMDLKSNLTVTISDKMNAATKRFPVTGNLELNRKPKTDDKMKTIDIYKK